MDLRTLILNKYTEDQIHEKIAEAIPEYLDENWAEEFDDEHEAYSEQGRGEAESQVLREIIQAESKEELPLEEYCNLTEALCEAWSIDIS